MSMEKCQQHSFGQKKKKPAADFSEVLHAGENKKGGDAPERETSDRPLIEKRYKALTAWGSKGEKRKKSEKTNEGGGQIILFFIGGRRELPSYLLKRKGDLQPSSGEGPGSSPGEGKHQKKSLRKFANARWKTWAFLVRQRGRKNWRKGPLDKARAEGEGTTRRAKEKESSLSSGKKGSKPRRGSLHLRMKAAAGVIGKDTRLENHPLRKGGSIRGGAGSNHPNGSLWEGENRWKKRHRQYKVSCRSKKNLNYQQKRRRFLSLISTERGRKELQKENHCAGKKNGSWKKKLSLIFKEKGKNSVFRARRGSTNEWELHCVSWKQLPQI